MRFNKVSVQGQKSGWVVLEEQFCLAVERWEIHLNTNALIRLNYLLMHFAY